LVNQFGYKASMHTAACGGLLAFSFTWVLNHFGAEALVASPPMQLYLGCLTLLFALVYLSRYRLGAHSHRELLGGTAIGVLVTFAFQLIWNL
jgi:membrane-associated phospholipid phosphatase